MNEPTLPPDIAAAIEAYGTANHDCGSSIDYLPDEKSKEICDQVPIAHAALEAAILGHLPVWRPIDTAPKDGTWILVNNPRGLYSSVYVVRWDTRDWPRDETTWLTLPLGSNPDSYAPYPTHWQPLPSPPSTDLGRAALAEDGRE